MIEHHGGALCGELHQRDSHLRIVDGGRCGYGGNGKSIAGDVQMEFVSDPVNVVAFGVSLGSGVANLRQFGNGDVRGFLQLTLLPFELLGLGWNSFFSAWFTLGTSFFLGLASGPFAYADRGRVSGDAHYDRFPQGLLCLTLQSPRAKSRTCETAESA